MTDRPCLYSGPMVQALLEDRKTQTRRLEDSPLAKAVPGDRLYVRENCWIFGKWHPNGLTKKTKRPKWQFIPIGQDVLYEKPDDGLAFFGGGAGWVFRPSMFMPRWASRLTDIVTEVRFQPLQDITEDDAIAEGVERIEYDGFDCYRDYSGSLEFQIGARSSYSTLWDSLHAHNPGESWADNPGVVAISFTVNKCNIDRMEK